MKTASSSFIQNKNAETSEPRWLFDIHYGTGSSQVIYLATGDSNKVFDGKTYLATPPITHRGLAEGMEGRNERVELQIGNADRYMQSFLEAYDGLRGQEVTIRMVFDDDLTLASSLSYSFTVDASSSNAQTVTLALVSSIDLLNIQLPGRLFSREMFPNVPAQDKVQI